MQLHDAQGIGRGEYSLVRKYGDIALTRDVGKAVNVRCGDRLLDEFDVKALFCHLCEDTYGLARLPRLICVDADAYVLPYCLAHGSKACHVKRGIDAHLDLERVIATCNRIACIACHLVGGIYTDGNIRDDAVLCAAEQLVHGDVPQLSVKIVECHVDGGLCRRVVDERSLYGLDQIFELVHIAANEQGSKMRTDRVNDAACRITRHNPCRRCLAVARCTRVCADEDNHVLHAVHAPSSRFERDAQGHGEHSKFDLCNFHGNPPSVYRILSDMRII